MTVDFLDRKRTHFVLWRPGDTDDPPTLVIGTFVAGNPPSLVPAGQPLPLRPSADHPDLWELPASECGLTDRTVYHYWFEVTDTDPYKNTPSRIRCTDPTAWTVDWRLRAKRLPGPYDDVDRDPAGVVWYENGRLSPCDPGGETPDWDGDGALADLPPNNRLVIYEIPTGWARSDPRTGLELGVGTFRDVRALVSPNEDGANFAGVDVLETGRAHLGDLGVNAIELLPPADSFPPRTWGYATSNYFAVDFDLGFPNEHSWPTATTDLTALVRSCHKRGIRVFVDVVMAFATQYSYRNVNYLDFHVKWGAGDPEQQGRDGFGGDLFKYNYRIDAYDPIDGIRRELVPARRLMLAYLTRWLEDFRFDGVRIDSVNNVMNWDFVEEYRNHARQVWRARWPGASDESIDERFLVVGEELSVPMALLTQNRLDGLWNERFKRLVRAAILGRRADEAASFEETVRRLVDCRLLGFTDGTQAVNYLTSHDVEGDGNERLFNYLLDRGVSDTEPRIRLAFACLLTAVGIPMILAGDEFADAHDLGTGGGGKQIDPVDFDRLSEPWRKRLFECVSRLVKLRTSCDALSVNDTAFLHTDLSDGKRVVVWRRGRAESPEPVVVVANFSDWGTPSPQAPDAEYVVPNWPDLAPGTTWREVTQDRDVPETWVGREPLYPWEAKVYVATAP